MVRNGKCIECGARGEAGATCRYCRQVVAPLPGPAAPGGTWCRHGAKAQAMCMTCQQPLCGAGPCGFGRQHESVICRECLSARIDPSTFRIDEVGLDIPGTEQAHYAGLELAIAAAEDAGIAPTAAIELESGRLVPGWRVGVYENHHAEGGEVCDTNDLWIVVPGLTAFTQPQGTVAVATRAPRVGTFYERYPSEMSLEAPTALAGMSALINAGPN